MKKLIPLFLVCVMILGLCACGSSSNGSTASAQADAPASENAPAAEEAAAPEDVITLVFSFSDPETNTQNTDIFQPFFDMVTEASGGRVQFECHYNGELVGLGEAYDAAAKGTVDIAYIRSGSLSYCPFESLIENPPITDTPCTRTSYVMNQLYSEYPELDECYPGVHFLLRYQMTYGYIGTTKAVVENYEDLKGKTLIIGSALAAKRAEAFGATPLDVLPPDFYTSLEKGLADGAITTTMPEMITYSWSDVIKNVTLVPVIKACGGLVMSEKAWNSLPEDIQQIFNDVMPQAVDMADEAINRANEEAIETLKNDYDTVFIEPSEDLLAAMRAADDESVQAWISELEASSLPNAGEIYTRYLELYNEYCE